MNPPPPSYTAVSGSIDQDCCFYTAIASAQNPKEELIEDFAIMFKQLLNRYSLKNSGKLPESILFFRDGVSESQFKQILASEVAPLQGRFSFSDVANLSLINASHRGLCNNRKDCAEDNRGLLH